MPEQQAIDWLSGKIPCPKESQISKEIDYFCAFYETLHPTVCLSYEWEAYSSLTGDDFRVTFDENILYCTQNLSLETEIYGMPLLSDDQVLMELKTPGRIPLWMTHFLTQQRIQKTSFSKYGTAYQMMQTHLSGGKVYA